MTNTETQGLIRRKSTLRFLSFLPRYVPCASGWEYKRRMPGSVGTSSRSHDAICNTLRRDPVQGIAAQRQPPFSERNLSQRCSGSSGLHDHASSGPCSRWPPPSRLPRPRDLTWKLMKRSLREPPTCLFSQRPVSPFSGGPSRRTAKRGRPSGRVRAFQTVQCGNL